MSQLFAPQMMVENYAERVVFDGRDEKSSLDYGRRELPLVIRTREPIRAQVKDDECLQTPGESVVSMVTRFEF